MTISNMDNLIYSRDVVARIEELESEREALVADLNDEKEHPAMSDDANDPAAIVKAENAVMDAMAALAAWDDENADELATLKKLAEEGADSAADWEYGETLIRDSYFREYAMELADDIGAIPANAGWPLECIDWDQAARELKMDYSAVDFGGVRYWVISG